MRPVLLVVIVAVLLSFFFYVSRDSREARFGVRRTGNSYMEGVTIVNRKDGNKNWVLTADRADITANGQVAYLRNIRIKMEKQGITVYAGKGSYDIADRSLTLDGRTVAQGRSYSITSQGVKFNSSRDNLATDGTVTIQGKKFNVRGKGMSMDNAQHRVRILGNVKAVFYN